MIEGTKIKLSDGQEYIFPPLNITLFRKHKEALHKLTVKDEIHKLLADQVYEITALPVLTDDLKRNYPEMTEERLADILPFGDCGVVLGRVLKGSGLLSGAAAAAGEVTDHSKKEPYSAT